MKKTRQSYLQQEAFNRDYYLSFYSFRNTPKEAFYFSLSRKGLLLHISSEISVLAKQSTDPAIQKQFNIWKKEVILWKCNLANPPAVLSEVKQKLYLSKLLAN